MRIFQSMIFLEIAKQDNFHLGRLVKRAQVCSRRDRTDGSRSASNASYANPRAFRAREGEQRKLYRTVWQVCS